VELDPGVRRRELPLHLDDPLIPVRLPRLHLPAQIFGRCDPLSRHCLASTDSSICARFSQMPVGIGPGEVLPHF
jgi:hypothetical protein